jgi:Fe-S-cluster-containing hydrogenase component 2
MPKTPWVDKDECISCGLCVSNVPGFSVTTKKERLNVTTPAAQPRTRSGGRHRRLSCPVHSLEGIGLFVCAVFSRRQHVFSY